MSALWKTLTVSTYLMDTGNSAELVFIDVFVGFSVIYDYIITNTILEPLHYGDDMIYIVYSPV